MSDARLFFSFEWRGDVAGTAFAGRVAGKVWPTAEGVGTAPFNERMGGGSAENEIDLRCGLGLKGADEEEEAAAAAAMSFGAADEVPVPSSPTNSAATESAASDAGHELKLPALPRLRIGGGVSGPSARSVRVVRRARAAAAALARVCDSSERQAGEQYSPPCSSTEVVNKKMEGEGRGSKLVSDESSTVSGFGLSPVPSRVSSKPTNLRPLVTHQAL